MTKESILKSIYVAVKHNGTFGKYIYIPNGVELKDGTIVNEVRLSDKKMGGVEFLEKGTNRVITKLGKTDLMSVYDVI